MQFTAFQLLLLMLLCGTWFFWLRWPVISTDIAPYEFEVQCADIDFCVHARPGSSSTAWRYFLTQCWLRNLFVWLGVALELAFPAPFRFLGMRMYRVPLSVAERYAPCLALYSYAPALGACLLYLMSWLFPLALWTAQSFVAMYKELRSRERVIADAAAAPHRRRRRH